jgi:NADPH-dependent 2,4-dienoyl-CoA reductase/sulfur reductase-like enzyme
MTSPTGAAPSSDGGRARAVVVGAGVAGLQTALVLRRLDPRREVVLLAKAAQYQRGLQARDARAHDDRSGAPAVG